MAPDLRALTEADLPDASRMLLAEGWGFQPRELARLLETGPGLSIAAEGPAGLVGLLTVARHGTLAWIGNVAVAADARGKGLGARLVDEALARARKAGVRTVKLVSVPKAVTLYERAGFVAEAPVVTHTKWHERPAHRPPAAEVLLADHLDELAALDARAFGGDRRAILRALLRDYPDTGVGVRGPDGDVAGYAFLKPGDLGTDLGPVVLARDDREVAAALLDGVLGFRLQGDAAGVECSVVGAHPWMAALLEERGFQARDAAQPKTLMRHGPALAQDWVRCAALAGLEKG